MTPMKSEQEMIGIKQFLRLSVTIKGKQEESV
jgi:hypothetical protein